MGLYILSYVKDTFLPYNFPKDLSSLWIFIGRGKVEHRTYCYPFAPT